MANRSLGLICLCAYLLIVGILALTNITIVAVNIIEAVLAIAAAVLLLLGR